MKLIPVAGVIALAACAAPDPAYQQALANVPQSARAACTYQAQMASAEEGWHNRHDSLGLMAMARYNRTERQCLEMMAQQYPATQPQYGNYQPQQPSNDPVEQIAGHAIRPSDQKGAALVRQHISAYGKAPVEGCYRQADAMPISDDDKALAYLKCIATLRPV